MVSTVRYSVEKKPLRIPNKTGGVQKRFLAVPVCFLSEIKTVIKIVGFVRSDSTEGVGKPSVPPPVIAGFLNYDIVELSRLQLAWTQIPQNKGQLAIHLDCSLNHRGWPTIWTLIHCMDSQNSIKMEISFQKNIDAFYWPCGVIGYPGLGFLFQSFIKFSSGFGVPCSIA